MANLNDLVIVTGEEENGKLIIMYLMIIIYNF